MVAIVSLKREAIHKAVRDMYTQVAGQPEMEFHFPTGAKACALLGYPSDLVSSLPESAVESFAGVGYPFAANVIEPGDRVLDIGSGSGTDALICSKLVGPKGRVFALDMTDGMRDKLSEISRAAKASNLEILAGDAESIPLPDDSVDVVTSNGVLNLVPNKWLAIEEIARVLKPGGLLQLSDIALTKKVSERYRQDPKMWAECVVGAVEEDQYVHMLSEAGLIDIEPIAEVDYFSHSVNEKTREVAGLFNAHSISMRARRAPKVSVGRAEAARRAALRLGREVVSIGGALLAWLICAGMPALISALGALGVGGLASHGVMFPLFVGMLGLGVWFLWRSGRLRDDRRPFWLGLGGALFAIATTWLALTGIYPFMAMWPHIGIACVVAASVWNYYQSRQPGNCLAEMIREEQFRQNRGGTVQRIALSSACVVAIGLVLYIAHVSV